jgi:LacI family transcriptional regulator
MRSIPPRVQLAGQAAQVLREELARGVWANHLPGERALSERLGVSRSTLRTALDVLRREGWIEVAQGHPTRILKASGQPATRPANVALLTPVPLRAMPPFMLHWLDELRDDLSAADYQLNVYVAPTCYRPRCARALESLVRRSPAAAWVLYLSAGPMQRWFQANALPCLVAGSCVPGVELPAVDVDYRAACRHAAGWLLALGRRHLAIVLPDNGCEGEVESERGFHEAFAHTSVEQASALVIRHDGTPKHLATVLDAVLGRPARPDGLIVARSAHTVTVVTHLQRRGVRVPEDATVVSRDDDAFLESIVPPIPRYVCQPAPFARRILRATLELALGGVSSTRPVRLLPKFVGGAEQNNHPA